MKVWSNYWFPALLHACLDQELANFVESHKRRRVEERARLVELQVQIDDTSHEIEDVRARNRELNLEIITQHNQKSLEITKLKQELEIAKRGSSTAVEERARLERNNASLREDTRRLLAQNAEQKDRLVVVEANLGKAEGELRQVKEECAKEREELRRTKEEKSALEKQRDELVERADDYQVEMVDLKKANARYSAEVARLFTEISALRPGSQASRASIKGEPY